MLLFEAKPDADVPLAVVEGVLYLAMADVLDEEAMSVVAEHVDCPVRAFVAPPTSVELLLQRIYASEYAEHAAASLLRTRGAQDMRFVCLLAAPEGINHFQAEHPDIPIWTAAIDEKLNDHGYILPGLGDAGDRMYGTK